jgi:hypothetical protein
MKNNLFIFERKKEPDGFYFKYLRKYYKPLILGLWIRIKTPSIELRAHSFAQAMEMDQLVNFVCEILRGAKAIIINRDYVVMAKKAYDELNTTKTKYYELIMAVSKKFPTESRHETALRYILQAENRQSLPDETCTKENQ